MTTVTRWKGNADLPAISYSKFAIAFDAATASRNPREVVDTLLAIPATKRKSMRKALLSVRHLFGWANDLSGPDARDVVAHLIEQRSRALAASNCGEEEPRAERAACVA